MSKPVESIYKDFGKLIKSRRVLFKMKQEDAAKVFGWARGTFANIEAGRQRLLLHDAITVAEYFRISIAEVIK